MSIKSQVKPGDYVTRTVFAQQEWQDWREQTGNRAVRVEDVEDRGGVIVYSIPEVLWRGLRDPWWDARGFGGAVPAPVMPGSPGKAGDTEGDGPEATTEGEGGEDGAGDAKGNGDGDGDGDEADEAGDEAGDTGDKESEGDKDQPEQGNEGDKKQKQSQSQTPPPEIPVGDLLTLEQVQQIRELVEKARADNPQWTDGFQQMCDLVIQGCTQVWQQKQRTEQAKATGVHNG